jgi:hypothetical protein
MELEVIEFPLATKEAPTLNLSFEVLSLTASKPPATIPSDGKIEATRARARVV